MLLQRQQKQTFYRLKDDYKIFYSYMSKMQSKKYLCLRETNCFGADNSVYILNCFTLYALTSPYLG